MTEASQQWTALCVEQDVPETGGHYVHLNGRALAVIRGEDGAVRVLDDTCPHAGASLAGGHVDGDCVICPWHGWTFDLHDGKCPDNPQIGVTSHPVRVESGRVLAQLPIIGCVTDE